MREVFWEEKIKKKNGDEEDWNKWYLLPPTWESLVKPTAFFNWATFRLFDEAGIGPVPAAAPLI